MSVYLVRHGEAHDATVNPERPLTDDGRKSVEDLAAKIKAAGFPIAKIIHSGITRAHETADIIRSIVAPELELDQHDLLAPNSEVDHWAGALEGLMDENIMLVGHMPYMSNLAYELSQKSIGFSTANCIVLEKKDGNWIVCWNSTDY